MATIPTKTAVVVYQPQHRASSRVQVGVRIRPLASQEIQSGGKSSLNVESPSIRMGQRQFTYDAIFDDSCGQKDLYDRVSGPLLSSFVDGYNATVRQSISIGTMELLSNDDSFLTCRFMYTILNCRSCRMVRLEVGRRTRWEARPILSRRHRHSLV